MDGGGGTMNRRRQKWERKGLPIDNGWMMDGWRDSFRQGGGKIQS